MHYHLHSSTACFSRRQTIKVKYQFVALKIFDGNDFNLVFSQVRTLTSQLSGQLSGLGFNSLSSSKVGGLVTLNMCGQDDMTGIEI